MTTIVIALVGLAFIVVVALIVAVVEARQAKEWRRIAAQRRQTWEANRPTEDYHLP